MFIPPLPFWSILITKKSVLPKKIYVPRKKREAVWKSGYLLIEVKPKHWMIKSRYVIEKAIGRPLRNREEVRYKDGDKLNCSLDNLIIMDFDNRTEWQLDTNGNALMRATPVWCRKYSSCRKCNSIEFKHAGFGLCAHCYGLYNRSPYWNSRDIPSFVLDLDFP